MFKPLLLAAITLAATLPLHAAELTAQEKRWLHAAAPVLNYSQQLKLPVDIIVQPQARPGDVPLAMGFDKGRCKLVFSMRGNPDAESVLKDVPEADQDRLIEAMAAHELAHCWRYAQGAWHALPAGFVEVGDETAQDAALLAASRAMRETRREEGFADLVALAWVQRSHPQDYARVHGWLAKVRGNVAVPRSGHDTRVWVKLAENGAQFSSAATPFEAASLVWREGLLHDE
ncbi:NUDIX hydrolase [Massilia sp. DD77]|uniref:NUDIX hydrolase n=1 Tax=Massilia sp. DD77 TaxID=3109349 RepID=UPI002FFDD740